MIVSEKSPRNLSDYIQFLFKIFFNLIKKGTISSEKLEIQLIMTIIMLTRFSERIFNPSRYSSIRVDLKTITAYLNPLSLFMFSHSSLLNEEHVRSTISRVLYQEYYIKSPYIKSTIRVYHEYCNMLKKM